jgi:hypothetical protein
MPARIRFWMVQALVALLSLVTLAALGAPACSSATPLGLCSGAELPPTCETTTETLGNGGFGVGGSEPSDGGHADGASDGGDDDGGHDAATD